MIGYHLTSFSNWPNITKKGLIPYRIKDHEEEFAPYIKSPVMGIWLWQERLDAVSEPMNVAWHCGKKKTNQIIVMSVEYDNDDVWTVTVGKERSVFSIIHNIELGVQFFENSKATLLRYRVPPKRIEFVKLYDWSKYIRIGEQNEQVTREKNEVAVEARF